MDERLELIKEIIPIQFPSRNPDVSTMHPYPRQQMQYIPPTIIQQLPYGWAPPRPTIIPHAHTAMPTPMHVPVPMPAPMPMPVVPLPVPVPAPASTPVVVPEPAPKHEPEPPPAFPPVPAEKLSKKDKVTITVKPSIKVKDKKPQQSASKEETNPVLSPLSSVSALHLQPNELGQRGGYFYNILTSNDDSNDESASAPIFVASEQLKCTAKYCAGRQRSFSVTISDPRTKKPVIEIHRPDDNWRLFCSSTFYGGDAIVKVTSDGEMKTLGKISMSFALCTPYLTISNRRGEIVALIKGPKIRNRVMFFSESQAEFSVSDWEHRRAIATICLSDEKVAETEEEDFESNRSGLQFEAKDLTAETKALLLASLIYIKISFEGFSKPCSLTRGWLLTEVLVLLAIVLYIKIKFL